MNNREEEGGSDAHEALLTRLRFSGLGSEDRESEWVRLELWDPFALLALEEEEEVLLCREDEPDEDCGGLLCDDDEDEDGGKGFFFFLTGAGAS